MKRDFFSKSLVFSITLILAVGLATILVGCAGMPPAGTSGGDRSDVLYSCNCGPQCKCNSVSVNPGNCKCGAPLKWGHVLKIEGNEALLCQCKEGCQCKIDPKDSSKCGCGMPVNRVNLQGTDIYFCNCGGSCFCNTVSGEPGKCNCGMNLKTVN